MRNALTPRTTRRAARAPGGPKPFSREWLNASPAERVTTQRSALGPAPGWLPTDRVAAIVLVAVLVLLVSVFHSRLSPGLRGQADSGIVAPIGTAVVDDERTPAPTAVGQATNPEAASTPIGGTSSELPDEPIFPEHRVLAYYGHPNAQTMGILGLYRPEELLAQLQDQARAYERADPERAVLVAFEIIGSVAQPEPQADGSFLLYTSPATLREYVEFTQANDIHLIIDIQIGRTSVEDEMALLEEFLIEPNVHLAIDPEFAMEDDQLPSIDIGSVDADDINYAQEELARIIEEHELPPKLLIVHRFTEGMVTNGDEIDEVDSVQIVLDFDGFGDPASKIEGYTLFASEGWVEYTGLKLFYDDDQPLMQPDEVLAIDPPPDFVMYQ